MERILIDRKEVLEFLEENFGFWEYIRMIAPRVGIDETEAIELADEVRLTIKDTGQYTHTSSRLAYQGTFQQHQQDSSFLSLKPELPFHL